MTTIIPSPDSGSFLSVWVECQDYNGIELKEIVEVELSIPEFSEFTEILIITLLASESNSVSVSEILALYERVDVYGDQFDSETLISAFDKISDQITTSGTYITPEEVE